MSDERLLSNPRMVAEEDLGNFEQFLEGISENELGELGFEQAVTIRSTAGGNFSVPTNEPATIADLIIRAGLTTSPDVEYWVDGVAVDPDFIVAPGATVMAMNGQVKGG